MLDLNNTVLLYENNRRSFNAFGRNHLKTAQVTDKKKSPPFLNVLSNRSNNLCSYKLVLKC